MSSEEMTIGDLGYEGPLETQCAREVDKMLFAMMKRQATNAETIMSCLRQLRDRIFVFEVSEVLAQSTDCFCAAHLMLKNGEVIVAVPWLGQYEAGACFSIYRKGVVDDFEIEAILAQLIELLEFSEAPNTQLYMM